MAVLFKYNISPNYTYAPGFTNAGPDGIPGELGESGNSVYFIDFDLNNSYNIELALQKIENNYLISNKSIKKLATEKNGEKLGREYKEFDIIISNSGNCYQIVKSSETSIFNNYKFDIKQLDTLKKQSYNNINHVRIYNVTGLKFYSKRTGKLIKSYDPRQLSGWVTNRTEKPYSTNFYKLKNNYNDDEDFALYGTWLKIFGISNSTDDTKSPKFSFSIDLNANKKYSLDGIFPLKDDNEVNVNFNKKLEFANLTAFSSEDIKSGTELNYNLLFNEVTTPGYPHKIPNVYTTYISDYSMDKMHPFGNNISCTLANNRNLWYNKPFSGYPEFNNKLKHNVYNNDNPEFFINRYKTIDNLLDIFGSGFSFTQSSVKIVDKTYNSEEEIETTYNNTSDAIEHSWFPDYANDLSVISINERDIQEKLTDEKSDDPDKLIIKDNYEIKNLEGITHGINNKSGNSLYFSSIDKEFVPGAIFSYITSTNNIFRSIIKDPVTKEISVSDIPIIVNNQFVNKSYYVTFKDIDSLGSDLQYLQRNLFNTKEDSLLDDSTLATARDDEDTTKTIKHFWSFKKPIYISNSNLEEGSGSRIVYFITNSTNENETLNITFNEDYNTYPLIKELQKNIFYNSSNNPRITVDDVITDLNTISDSLYDIDEEFRSEITNVSSGYKAYKITVKAVNPYTDTYVSVRLKATYNNKSVISEPVVSCSSTSIADGTGDYPKSSEILKIEEKVDLEATSFNLSIKNIPDFYWYAQIGDGDDIVTIDNQQIDYNGSFTGGTPYTITYAILNNQKNYFLSGSDKVYAYTVTGILSDDIIIDDTNMPQLYTEKYTVTVNFESGDILRYNNILNPDSIVINNIAYGTKLSDIPAIMTIKNGLEVNGDELEGYENIILNGDKVYMANEFSTSISLSTIVSRNIQITFSPIEITERNVYNIYVTIQHPDRTTSYNESPITFMEYQQESININLNNINNSTFKLVLYYKLNGEQIPIECEAGEAGSLSAFNYYNANNTLLDNVNYTYNSETGLLTINKLIYEDIYLNIKSVFEPYSKTEYVLTGNMSCAPCSTGQGNNTFPEHIEFEVNDYNMFIYSPSYAPDYMKGTQSNPIIFSNKRNTCSFDFTYSTLNFNSIYLYNNVEINAVENAPENYIFIYITNKSSDGTVIINRKSGNNIYTNGSGLDNQYLTIGDKSGYYISTNDNNHYEIVLKETNDENGNGNFVINFAILNNNRTAINENYASLYCVYNEKIFDLEQDHQDPQLNS